MLSSKLINVCQTLVSLIKATKLITYTYLYFLSPLLKPHSKARCAFLHIIVTPQANNSPMARTLDPSGPVSKWKYTVDMKLLLYRDGDVLRRDAPFIGPIFPLDADINRKESSPASLLASRASSNKHNPKSPTCADVPATLKLPLKGFAKSIQSVAVAEKTPTSSATEGWIMRSEHENTQLQ